MGSEIETCSFCQWLVHEAVCVAFIVTIAKDGFSIAESSVRCVLA